MPPPSQTDPGLVTATRYRADHTTSSADRWRWLAPVLLGALALVVRLPNLDHVANTDEIYHFLAAQGWLAEGQLSVAEGFYERTPLFTIFVAQWLALLGESLIVARLPSVIAGIALVVLVFLWTRAVAGNLAAVLAGLFLALDPELVEQNQILRFYSLQCLLFWLGAVGAYQLVTSPPSTLGRAILLAAGTLICFWAALYLQVTTLIGLSGIAVWLVLTLGLPWLSKSSPRARWVIGAGVVLLGVATVGVLIEAGWMTELLARYRSSALFQADNRDEFWYYHFFLLIFYPTLWPLLPLAVVIGLAYRPRPTGFCACVVAVAFLAHSFAGAKAMRYFTYAEPFLFVLWATALAEIWPRLRGFLQDVSARALAWLGLERLGRPGVVAVLAVVLGFTVVANGALVRTAANVLDIVIPPMRKAPDWAAAKEPLAPWLSDASIVLTTSDLETLYYLGRYEVLISNTRQSELSDRNEFSIDRRTGRPIITTPESLALIMDCYPDGLIVTSGFRWRSPEHLDDAVANLVEARAEEIKLDAFDMQAYTWQRPDEARRAEACAGLPLGLGDAAMTSVNER